MVSEAFLRESVVPDELEERHNVDDLCDAVDLLLALARATPGKDVVVAWDRAVLRDHVLFVTLGNGDRCRAYPSPTYARVTKIDNVRLA